MQAGRLGLDRNSSGVGRGGLDTNGTGVGGRRFGGNFRHLTVTDYLQRLHIVRGAKATPVPRGGAQQVLLQVTADLDLGAVGADHLQLAIHPLVDPDEPGWPEVDAGGGCLVAVDARNATRRHERGVVHVAVVLVHVVAAVGVDDGGLHFADHALDRPDRHPAVADAEAGVCEVGVEQPRRHQLRGPPGLHDSLGNGPARLAAREGEDVHTVAECGVAQQDPAAPWLPYIGLTVGFGVLLGATVGHPFFPDVSLVLVVIGLAALVAARQFLAQRELGRVQATLRESEWRFRAIFDNAAVGITYTDLDGPTIVDSNSTFSKMVGYTPEELRGGDYSHIAQGDFRGADRALAEAIRSGKVDQLQQELGYKSADGSARQAMLSVSTVPDEQGQPSHVVGIFEDITRRRRAERAKEEFVSIVGHELRTPLTSIRGSLGLLEGGLLGELPQEAMSMVGLAVANTDRLARLVNDILDIERMDAGHLPLERAPIGVGELVRQSAQALRGTAEDAGVQLRTEIEELTVCADVVLCNHPRGANDR